VIRLASFAVLTILYAFSASAQVHIGFNGGMALYPISGRGNLYDPEDTPHKEYGLSAGINLKVHLSKTSFLLTHSNISTYKSHFHVANPLAEGVLFKGFYQLSNIRQSLSLNKIHLGQNLKRTYNLKSFFGMSINSGNLTRRREKSNEDLVYSSDVTVRGNLYPEFFTGIGLEKKIRGRGIIYYDLSLNILPFEKIESSVNYSVLGGPFLQDRFIEGHKYLFLNIIYFFEKGLTKKRKNWSICK
jgi:hypothetical protein